MENKPYLYDKDLQKVTCCSYVDFIKTLHILQTKNKINVNKSLSCPNYTLITETGDTKEYFAWYNLFPKLEEDFGIDHNPLKSHSNSYIFSLFLNKPLEGEDVTLDLSVLQEESFEQEEEVSEELISFDVEDVVEEVIVEEVSSQESVDWDYVDSLYDDSDKKGSKDLLEDYARKWNVELAKNKSFANMVKDFKEAL